MVVDEEPTIKDLYRLHRSQRSTNGHQPPITQVCRPIRQETIPHYYKTKSDDCWNISRSYERPKIFGKLMKSIGWQNRQHISGLRISDSDALTVTLKRYTYYL